MQSTVECPVCVDFYAPRTRVPKTLFCGHGVCEPCVQSLLLAATGPAISCPTCRAICTIPDRQAENLPTNFPILQLLESLCGDCRDRPHTQRCGHCTLNVCDICRETHQSDRTTDLTDDIRNLKQAMDDLNDLLPVEKEFQSIMERGDIILDEFTEHYNEQRRQLEDTYQKNKATLKAEIQHNLNMLLEWKEKSKKLYVDCETFLDRHRYQIQQTSPDSEHIGDEQSKEELNLKLEAMTTLTNSKPKECHILADQLNNFSQILSTRTLSSCETQTDAVIISTPVPVPDYSAASYKAMFDHQLAWPIGICTDPVTGCIITSDLVQHEVIVLSADLQLVRRFGVERQGSNQYDMPYGVVVSDGHLCICDQGNDRIHVTNLQGEDMCVCGSYGKGRKHFDHPCDLSCDNAGLLYICDAGNKRIKVIDRRGALVREFGHAVFDGEPWYNAVSAAGRVAVTTSKNINIYLFTICGEHIETINIGQHKIRTAGVAFDDHGHLLVVDRAGGRVAVMKETGDVVCFIGSPGSGPGQLKDPKSLSVTKDGDVVICDKGNKRIQLFSIPKK